jgi:hypothetical protein
MMIIQGLCQSNSQQIISQYVDDILFTTWVEESNVNNLVRILFNLRFAYGPELIGMRVWRIGVGQRDSSGMGGEISMDVGHKWRPLKSTWHSFWLTCGVAKH